MLSSINQLDFEIESLEQRLNLAGNVSVGSLANGDLLFQGDGSGNSMVLERRADGNIWAQGTEGTTVNGVEVGLLISDSSVLERGLTFRMRGGDDNVALIDLTIAGSLTVDAGGGDDLITMRETSVYGDIDMDARGGRDLLEFDRALSTGDVDLTTHAGNDSIQLWGENPSGPAFFGLVVEGQSSINLGGGDDDVTGQLESDGIQISAGGGNDRVVLDAPIVDGDLQISLASGDDYVRVEYGYLVGDVSINTGGGNDLLSLKDAYVDDSIAITTGSGHDLVAITNSNADGVGTSLNVSLGGGNDGLLIGCSDFANSAEINSGGGADLLLLGGEYQALEVATAGGADTVVLNRVEVSDSLSIDLGGQNDELYSSSSTLPASGVFMGGAGIDTAQTDRTGGWQLTLDSFEEQPGPQPLEDVVLGGIFVFGIAWVEQGGDASDLACD